MTVISDRVVRHEMDDVIRYCKLFRVKVIYIVQNTFCSSFSHTHNSILNLIQTNQPHTYPTMPHSKVPGGAGMSDKEAKKQAQSM